MLPALGVVNPPLFKVNDVQKNYHGDRMSGMNDHILSLRSLPEGYEEVLSGKVTENMRLPATRPVTLLPSPPGPRYMITCRMFVLIREADWYSVKENTGKWR